MALSQQDKDQMKHERILREVTAKAKDALVGKTIEQVNENRYMSADGSVITKAIINARGSIANVVIEGADFSQRGMVGATISDVDFVPLHHVGPMGWSIKIYSGGRHSYMVGEIFGDTDPAEAVQVY
jgi:hypothetical protein